MPQAIVIDLDQFNEHGHVSDNAAHDSWSEWRQLQTPVFTIELDKGSFSKALTLVRNIKSENSRAQFIFLAESVEFEHVAQLMSSAAGAQFYDANSKVDLSEAYKIAVARLQQPEPAKALDKYLDCQHRAMMAVHRAESVVDVELQVTRELKDVFELSWVRIFLHAPEFLDEQLNRINDLTLYKKDLTIQARSLGKIVFARPTKYSKREEEALLQISESVAFALDRLAKIDQAESLKQQWESTFDAISEPLCLTDENFNVLRTNKAFLEVSGMKAAQTIGTNCFAAFCGPKGAKNLMPQAGRFVLERGDVQPRHYEVTTQRILTGESNPQILLILFRDITEQKKIEKRIFESAKMAELGTIGSSIAHDINNPLGGMISFLQLIRMDLAHDHPMRADILDMEAAGQRCKEIVENLLRFSRRQEADSSEIIDIKEVVRQAIKIIELQTRSLGIELEIVAPPNEVQFLGQFNLLSQALSQVLQNAYEAVVERLQQNPGDKGRIHVEVRRSERQLEIQIVDNGTGISAEHQTKILNPIFLSQDKSGPSNSLQSGDVRSTNGLTLAYQIVDQHGGQLEIISQPNVGTTVKMTFLNV